MSRKKGDIVICITDKLKLYEKGFLYEIEVPNAQNSNKNWLDKVKIKGFKIAISFTNNFRKVTERELRREKLRNLKGEERGILTETKSGRKIDRNPEERAFRLIELLMSRYVTDRKSLDYPDSWKKYGYYNDLEGFIKKVAESDKVFDVEIEDFNEIKDMKLFDALDLFIRNKTKF